MGLFDFFKKEPKQRVETISNLDAEDAIDKDLFIEDVDSPSEETPMPINGNHIAIDWHGRFFRR